ncbi:MAG: hypothetical protein EPO64_01255 [Nitrospirae bacterium]|nr:MAG: hypothetical protein EPO64_01255 [Nitrospirota bacterium]
MKHLLWWLCLFVAPIALITIELFHPSGFTAEPGMYEFLSQPHHHEPQYWALAYFGPHWWLVMHVIQTPMVGLVAVGLWLMVNNVDAGDGTAARVAARLARAAIFVFAVAFTVLDAIGGIGLGRTLLAVQELVATGKLSPSQVEGVVLLLNTLWVDPLVGGVGSVVSLTASWAAFAVSVLVAASLLLAGRAGWLNMAVLVAFGWELQTAHASPHGPIAFALLIVAAGWLWWARRRASAAKAGAAKAGPL